MSARSLAIGFVVVALVTFAQTSMVSATVLYDDFNGTAIDPDTWYVPGGGFTEPTVADSCVNEVHPQAMAAYQQIVPGDTMYFKIGSGPMTGGLFGGDYLSIRNDQTAGYWQLVVWNTTQGGAPYYWGPNIGPFVEGDVVKLDWGIDGTISAYKNDVQYGSTTVKTEPIQNFGAGPGAGSSMSFDVISINQAPPPVPEPSTIVLLATGLLGLLAYAWRKRK
jgi:hypothetical protein